MFCTEIYHCSKFMTIAFRVTSIIEYDRQTDDTESLTIRIPFLPFWYGEGQGPILDLNERTITFKGLKKDLYFFSPPNYN